MKNYKAILFHPEGDFVTDFRDRKEVKDVWNCIADMGSKWIFYPLAFVSTDNTIIDTPDGMEWMKGRRIKTVQKFLQQVWPNSSAQILDALNNGYLPSIYTN